MTVSPPVSALGGHAGLGSAPAFDGRVFTSVPPSLQTGVNNSGGLISEPPQQNIAYGYSVAPESQQLYQYSSSCQQCAPVCESVVCSSCCAGPCDEVRRSFAFRVGGLMLFRAGPDEGRLFFTPGNAVEQINSAEFGFDAASGFESAVLFYDQQSFTDLEIKAMWADEWAAETSQAFSGVTVQIAADPVLGTSGPRIGTSRLTSQFGSVELNARRRMGQGYQGVTLVGGLRLLRVNEGLNTALLDPANVLPPELISTQTQNDLYGLQLGIDSTLIGRPQWCISVSARTGLYANDTDQQTTLTSLATPPVTFSAGGDSRDLAWHAEIGVVGKWQLNGLTNITFGYRAIYVDGLALAPEQLAVTDFLTTTGLSSDSHLLLHAATVGVELSY